MLGDEGLEQLIQRLHHRRVATDLVWPVLFDQADALVLDVAGDDTGERAAQVGGQFVGRQVAAQFQVGHVFVGRIERALEAFVDLQQPVEMERVIAFAAELFDRLEALSHLTRDFSRVVDDDLVVLLRGFTQRSSDKRVQLLQIRCGMSRSRENHGEGQAGVVRVHQDAEQVQELFGRAGAAPEK